MHSTRLCSALIAALVAAPLAQPLCAQPFASPLAEEPIPSVRTLPEKYPASWIIVHDFNFHAVVDGRGVVVDTNSPAEPLKGWVQVAQFGNILHASTAPELYSAETYYSRLSRGERTDVITIWDKATLKPKGEIVLPGGKRQHSVTYKNSFQFTNGEKWALVSNFTPAQSVTVVDLERRKVLGEIELPGCALIYPTGERGFTTFCADGTMTSLVLDAEGKVASTVTSKPIHDIDNQPMFGMPAMVSKTAWFVTFRGQLRGIDLSGQVARDLGPGFAIGTAEGANPEWRPGGWQVIASGAGGRLYVLMNSAGREGSHKDGGTEVWVVDPAKKARIARIPLQGVGSSIEVTREARPKLVVARVDSVVDVYDAVSGAFLHSLGARVAFNPQTLTAVE
jgi:methylamine dehydrogenase heavy chain